MRRVMGLREMMIGRLSAAVGYAALLGCPTHGTDSPFGAAEAPGSATEPTDGSDAEANAPSGGGPTSAETPGSADNSGASLFDVGSAELEGGAPGDGCEKVDFLFVVDDSTSMSDDQINLTNSFPGFIETILTTINAKDYQIMVVDSDEWITSGGVGTGFDQTCQPAPSCCLNCSPPSTCNGAACIGPEPPGPAPNPPPSPCDPMLGAGRTLDMYWQACGIAGGHRFIVDGQPNLEGTFSCIAMAGQWGDSDERVMEAMVKSVGPAMTDAGGCNEGFVRDDAILVVTFVTDEPDDASAGDPATWKQALVDAKGGNEDAIVVLGLIADGENTPSDACNLFGAGGSAPRLSEFIHSFGAQGIQGSVCELDYTPFFVDAVSTIDLSCDNFVPEG